MWTEVHFPNGDRVMVSLAADGMKLWKISRWGALFGRQSLATIDNASLDALAAQASANTRDTLIATGVFDPVQAARVARGSIDPSSRLDTITSVVCALDSADDVRAFDFPGALGELPHNIE